MVHESLAIESFTQAHVAQEVHRSLLEDARPDPLPDVLLAPVLEHDRFDPLEAEQVREQQAGRSRSDDPDLGPVRHQEPWGRGSSGSSRPRSRYAECSSSGSARSASAVPSNRTWPPSRT